MHAALALDGLEQDRGRLRADVLGKRLGGCEDRAGHERLECFPLRRLAGHRERAERAPVERAVERDELAAPGHLARPLERGFDRLRARVAEERLRAAEDVGELQRQLLHRLGGVEIRDVPQPVELRVRRREWRRVAVAEADDGDAGEQVEIALAVGVDEPRAFAVGERDVEARVGGEELRERGDVRHATTAVQPISAAMPLPAASAAARSLGTMPPSNAPASSIRVARSTLIASRISSPT